MFSNGFLNKDPFAKHIKLTLFTTICGAKVIQPLLQRSTKNNYGNDLQM